MRVLHFLKESSNDSFIPMRGKVVREVMGKLIFEVRADIFIVLEVGAAVV